MNVSLVSLIFSFERFSVKSKSISTDNLGNSTAVKFMAVPPLRASLFLKILSLFKNFNISDNLNTFSRLSLIKFVLIPVVYCLFYEVLHKQCKFYYFFLFPPSLLFSIFY